MQEKIKVALYCSGGLEKGFNVGYESLVNLMKEWDIELYHMNTSNPILSDFQEMSKKYKEGYKIITSGIPINSILASVSETDIIDPADITKKDPQTIFNKVYINKKELTIDSDGLEFKCLPIWHPLYYLESKMQGGVANIVNTIRSYIGLTPTEEKKVLHSSRSSKELKEFIDRFVKDNEKFYVSYDIETNFVPPLMAGFSITGFSLAFNKDEGIYVVLNSSDFNMEEEERNKCLDLLKMVLQHPNSKVIVHNLKMEVPATLNQLDYEIPENKLDDTMVWSKLINSGRTGGNGLKEQAVYRLGYSDWSEDVDFINSIKSSIKKTISATDRKGHRKVEVSTFRSEELENLVKKYYPDNYLEVSRDLIDQIDKTYNIYSYGLIPAKILEKYGAIDAISTFELFFKYHELIIPINKKFNIDMEVGYELWLESMYASYLLELNSSRWDELQAGSDERAFTRIKEEDLRALLSSDEEVMKNHIMCYLRYSVMEKLFKQGEYTSDIESSPIFKGYTGTGKIRYENEDGKVKNINPDKYEDIMKIFNLSKNRLTVDTNIEYERLMQSKFSEWDIDKLLSVLNPNSDVGKGLIMNIIQDDLVKSSKFILDLNIYTTSDTYQIDLANKEFNQGELELIDLVKQYNPNLSVREKFELYESIMKKLGEVNIGSKLSRMIVEAGEWKMSTLDEANMTDLYNLYSIAGFDIDNDHDGDTPFARLFHIRRYKKTDKLVTTYIRGDKLGRSQVYVVDKKELQSGKKLVRRKRQYKPGEVISDNEDLIFQGSWGANSVMSGRWSSGIHCLVGETKVRMLDGSDRSMEEMYKRYLAGEDQHVISITDDKKWVVAKVSEVLLSGYVDKVAKVYLDNGEIITCTTDHRFLGRDNNYYQAKDLTGMSMMPYYEKVVDGRRSVSHIDTTGSTFLYHLSKDYIMRRDSIDYKKDIIAHHIDKNPLNDDPSNLELLDRSTHLRRHLEVSSAGGKGNKGKILSDERRSQMSKVQKESKFNSQRREVMIQRNKDPEYQKKCREWTKTEEGKKHLSDRAGKVNEYINSSRPDILKLRSESMEKRNERGVMADGRCKSSLRKAYDILGDALSWDSYESVRSDIKGSLRSTIEKRLGSLSDKDMIEVAKTYNHKVLKVEIVSLGEKIPVYDLHVNKDTPCFVLSCGVVSHNTLPAWSDPKRYLSSRFKGGCSVIADFSQAELRVVARASNEEHLLDAYANGEDVHMKTAMNIFKKPASEISEVERRFSKMGCLVGNTKIKLMNGTTKTIEEIYEDWMTNRIPFYVPSFDREKGLAVGRCVNVQLTKYTDKICRVTFDDGNILECTPDHPLLLKGREDKYLRADSSLNYDVEALYYRYQEKGAYYGYEQWRDTYVRKKNNKGIPCGYTGKWEMTHLISAREYGILGVEGQVSHEDDNRVNNERCNLRYLNLSTHAKKTRSSLSDGFGMNTQFHKIKKYMEDNGIEMTVENYNNARSKVYPTDYVHGIASPKLETLIKIYGSIDSIPEPREIKTFDYFPTRKGQSTKNPNCKKVVKVEMLELDQPVPVYDLSVEKYHNYVVDFCDGSGIYVHNTFHILYGGDPTGFANSYLNGDVSYASKIFEGFYGGYPKLKIWKDSKVAEVEKYGLVTTMTNRYIFLGHEQPGLPIDKIMRQSGNAPIQGPSSDIAASAVFNISDFIEKKNLKSKLYCFIHDSIEADVSPDELFYVMESFQYQMNNYPMERFRVPAKSDLTLGATLGEEVEVISYKPDSDYKGGYLHLEGNGDEVDRLLARWSEFWDTIEVNWIKRKTKYNSYRELFAVKRCFTRRIGIENSKVELEVRLRFTDGKGCKDKFPEYDDLFPLEKPLIKADLNPYTEYKMMDHKGDDIRIYVDKDLNGLWKNLTNNCQTVFKFNSNNEMDDYINKWGFKKSKVVGMQSQKSK